MLPFHYRGSMNIPEVKRAVSAYSLGVRVFQPNATVEYAVCNQWRNAELEAELGRWMLARGCALYAGYMDGSEGQQAFVKAGRLAVGVKSDMGRHLDSENLLASATYNWEIAYEEVLNSVISGTAWPPNVWLIESGLDTGVVTLTPPTQLVPSSVRALATALQSKIARDEFEIFTGPIYDNDGNLQVPPGTSIPDEAVEGLDFLVAGVNNIGLYEHVSCSPGHYTDPMSLTCRKCPVGTAQKDGGVVVFECAPCQAGSYALEEGSTTCTQCAPGLYKAQTGSGSCSPCPAGSFSNANNTAQCTPCPPGSFSATEGAGKCDPCPVGQYQRNEGASSCLECPLYATTLTTGSDDKSACMCAAGYQQASDSDNDDAQPALHCITVAPTQQTPADNTVGIAVSVVILCVNLAAIAAVLAFFFMRVFNKKDKKQHQRQPDEKASSQPSTGVAV